jgi:beta-glucanase (GH16 family)
LLALPFPFTKMIITSLLATLGSALLMAHPSQPAHGPLVFEQDFSKMKRLDPNIWIWNDGPVYNHEAEKYTNEAAHNAFIANGALVIEARKEGNQVTSARLESKKSWKYGYFEIRAKVPPGRGTWPAVWLLNQHIRDSGTKNIGWPRCGEIDIMENVGVDPNQFHFSLHSEDFNFMKKNQRTKIAVSDSPHEFHTFGLEWRPEKIVFYMDGAPEYEVDKTSDSFANWPFRDPFYMILNLAIGGDWGGYKGVDPSIFPARYEISSIRIYK